MPIPFTQPTGELLDSRRLIAAWAIVYSQLKPHGFSMSPGTGFTSDKPLPLALDGQNLAASCGAVRGHRSPQARQAPALLRVHSGLGLNRRSAADLDGRELDDGVRS